jgi:hypothetical protein
MTAVPEVVGEPGVYYDLPASVYHAQHDWLSWSMMKRLVPPSTPAHFKAAMRQGEERKRSFDLGKVTHTLVLGDGDEFEVVQALNKAREPYDAVDYKTVSAQQSRDEIYDRGHVPILRSELIEAQQMADAIKAHPTAGALLSRPGKPEVSLFWVDPDAGVKCRARVDWLPDSEEGRRLVVADVKTAVNASPSEFSRAAGNLGYYGQRRHYLDGIKALGLDTDPAWLFIVVEKTDPYLVNVAQYVTDDDLRLSRKVVDHCRRLYRDCLEADRWPGYGDGINELRIPTYLHYSLEEALA